MSSAVYGVPACVESRIAGGKRLIYTAKCAQKTASPDSERASSRFTIGNVRCEPVTPNSRCLICTERGPAFRCIFLPPRSTVLLSRCSRRLRLAVAKSSSNPRVSWKCRSRGVLCAIVACCGSRKRMQQETRFQILRTCMTDERRASRSIF